MTDMNKVHCVIRFGSLKKKNVTFRPYRIFIASSPQNGVDTNIKLY